MNNKIGILQGIAIVFGALLILLFSSAYIVSFVEFRSAGTRGCVE